MGAAASPICSADCAARFDQANLFIEGDRRGGEFVMDLSRVFEGFSREIVSCPPVLRSATCFPIRLLWASRSRRIVDVSAANGMPRDALAFRIRRNNGGASIGWLWFP